MANGLSARTRFEARNLFEFSADDLVAQGSAHIVSPWEVDITHADGRVQRLSTRAIVIATGAEPFVPPLPGLTDVGFLTSDTLWNLRTLPARLVVLGGGLGLADGLYRRTLESAMRRHIWWPEHRDLPLVSAALGADSAIIGAARAPLPPE